MKFHVVTRCCRPENILTVAESVYADGVDVTWHIVFDTSKVKELDVQILGELYRLGAVLYFRDGDGWGLSNLNDILNNLSEGYVFHLDDDNLMHPDYYSTLSKYINEKNNVSAFCYNQFVDKKDFTGLEYRIASPENIKVKGIDLAQYTVHTYMYKLISYGPGYTADGEFIEALYNLQPSDFVFINETLCYYNYLQQVAVKKSSAPKILYIGEGKPELKSNVYLGYEDTSLNVYYNEAVDEVDPDAIITVGGSFEEQVNLMSAPLDIRRRWVHFEEAPENLGEIAYGVAMNYILNAPIPKVSFFTPAYNTPLDRLWRLYNSIKAQTSHDWEWVIVNDSPKNKRLSDELYLLSQFDSRVRVFTF